MYDDSGLGKKYETFIDDARLESGKKYDEGKLRMDLLSVPALRGTSDVLTFGATKYEERNWELGIKFSRVYGALLRHITSWQNGEDLDPESGLPHVDHAACCIHFLQHYIHNPEIYKELDDRP